MDLDKATSNLEGLQGTQGHRVCWYNQHNQHEIVGRQWKMVSPCRRRDYHWQVRDQRPRIRDLYQLQDL